MSHKNAIWVVAVAVASIFCWQAAQSAPHDEEDEELYRLFVDALEHVDRSYVKEVDRRKLIESAIHGMLENLDPYSNFIGPTEWKQFDRQTRGKFGGVGIQISQKDGILTVISPLVGTPAYEAGIQAGDRILEVNGESITKLSLPDVVDRLTGAPDTEVALTVGRGPRDSKPFTVKLKRALINVESVLGDTHGLDDRWDFMLDKTNKIGYIRISSFIPNTKADLDAAIKKLQDEGMKGLVLDLRFNPGGLLNAAIEVSDLFVEEGKIVSTKGRSTIDKTYYAAKEGTLPNFPMAILINQGSASASEIVSACLQDHKRAVVIGERSWGKGSVQNVIELEGGKSALKLTTASYNRPNGSNIHRFNDSKDEDEWGVKPDSGFEVKLTPKERSVYSKWRMVRDRITGKKLDKAPAEEKSVDPQAKKPEEPKAADDKKPTDEKKPDDAKKSDAPKKEGDKKDGKEKEEADDDGAEDDKIDVPANFKDLQLEKALDYVRGALNKDSSKVAEAPKAK